MSTFLEIARKVAEDSGTVSGSGRPTTVVGQAGRLLKIVNWTAEAWENIQNHRSQWRWMRTEIAGNLVASTQRYTPLAFGIATRFGEWIIRGESETRWSCYKNSLGVSDEGALIYLDWETFYESQLRGTPPTNSKPRYFSIDDQNKIVFSPTPDAAYTVRGLYRKDVQALTVDADVPEMPARFHTLIKWEALKLLGNFDETSPVQIAVWANNARKLMSELERDQLPPMRLCGPLA